MRHTKKYWAFTATYIGASFLTLLFLVLWLGESSLFTWHPIAMGGIYVAYINLMKIIDKKELWGER